MPDQSRRFSPREVIDRFIESSQAFDEEVIATEDIHKKSEAFRREEMDILEPVAFLIGQKVIASGQLAQRLDEPSAELYRTGLYLPNEALPRIKISGAFQTSRILPIVQGLDGEVVNRFMHTVEESSETLASIHHDPRPQPKWENISATDAMLFPLEPINAHSVVEMEKDEFGRYVDKIMMDPESEEFGELEKIKAIGDMMDHLLEQKGHAPNRINHRRVSWLNAQELFAGRTVRAVNFVWGHPDIGESLRGRTFSDTDQKSVEIVAGNFTVLDGYSRNLGSNSIYHEGTKALYLRGKAGGFDVTVPVKYLLEII